MKKLRSMLAVVVICALVVSLSACGGGEAAKNGPAQQSGAQNQPAESGAKGNEAVELTYWEMMWGPAGTYTEAVNKLVNKFNEENGDNIKVKVQMTPWDNYYQVFLTAISSGAAPDVSTGAFPQAVQYARMDEILYLDSIIEEWKAENIADDFMPGMLDLHKYEGKQAGIPWVCDPRGITYRTDLFEKAGITKLPQNWDEFLDVCRAIKSKTGVVPFVFGTANNMGTHIMMNFMFNNGVGITDQDIKSMFTDERVAETLRMFAALYKEKLIPEGIAGYKDSDAAKVYYSGNAAMVFQEPPTALKDYPDIEKVSSIMPPLAGPKGQAQNFAWVNPIMAYKQTKSPDAAKKFIKWWMENNLPLWTEGKASSLPARLSFMKDPYFAQNKFSKEFIEKIIPTVVSPVWPAKSIYTQFSQIEGENYLGKALQEITTGNTDYEGIAKKTDELIVNALKQ